MSRIDLSNSRLLAPMTFRNGRTAPNRVWVAPMTNKASHPDGTLSDDEFGFLVARAAGGFGVVETCASHVTPDGQAWPGELAMYDDVHVPGWRRLAEAHRRRAQRAVVGHGDAQRLVLLLVAFVDGLRGVSSRYVGSDLWTTHSGTAATEATELRNYSHTGR